MQHRIAERIAELMGWPADRVEDLAAHIHLVRVGGEDVVPEFRWHVGVVEGSPLREADPNGEVFAENVAAEMKEQRSRWGVVLPWDEPN